jgi:hypothetical protein
MGTEGHKIVVDDEGIAHIEGLEDSQSLDKLLAAEGMTSLADRVPVLTIGSNRAPNQLANKLSDMENEDDRIVPVFEMPVEGMDVVLLARPSFQGSFPAGLYAGPETEVTTVNLAVAFLTQHQLGVIDASEGASYQRVEMPGLSVTVDDKEIPVEFYKGTSAVFWDKQGPHALEAIKAEGRTIPAHNQADFFDLVLQHLERKNTSLWNRFTDLFKRRSRSMNAFKDVFFDPKDETHKQILRSYRNTPAYPQELSATLYDGHHDKTIEKRKNAGTEAVLKLLGSLGLSKTVGVPEGFRTRAGRDLRLR